MMVLQDDWVGKLELIEEEKIMLWLEDGSICRLEKDVDRLIESMDGSIHEKSLFSRNIDKLTPGEKLYLSGPATWKDCQWIKGPFSELTSDPLWVRIYKSEPSRLNVRWKIHSPLKV
jgi:hypothetical protein